MSDMEMLYARIVDGDHLTNEELVAGIAHFRQLERLALDTGPVFRLAANEAGRVARVLESYQAARYAEWSKQNNIVSRKS